MVTVKQVGFSLAIILGISVAGLFLFRWNRPQSLAKGCEIKVLSYPSFIASWGPGPGIAQAFEASTGCHVNLQAAEDSGLLLAKLSLFPADVVIGFDQFSLAEAREARAWRPIMTELIATRLPKSYQHREFVAFDWGPMAFVYREGEVIPPASLDDLLMPAFAHTVTLQDPRTSTPGLQFLLWVLREKGIEPGFAFLRQLKKSIHSVSPSWSTAYGLFQKKQAKLTFSYLTSPVYHWTQVSDRSYRPAIFASGHPLQVEYAGVPVSCKECDAAEQFVRFLLSLDTQKEIMQKNVMFPVRSEAEQGSDFAELPAVKILEPPVPEEILRDKKRLLERWVELGL